MKWKLPILISGIAIALIVSGIYFFISKPNTLPMIEETKDEPILGNGESTIARVQYKHTYDGSTKTATFTSDNTAGNFIIVFASYYGSTLPGISDSQGNSYTHIASVSDGASLGTGQYAWYAENIKGGANTITLTGTLSDIGLTAMEYSGVATAGSFLASTTQTQTLLYSITSTISVSSTGMIVEGWFNEVRDPANVVYVNGFTEIQRDTAHRDFQGELLNIAPSSSVLSGWTWTAQTGNSGGGIFAAFKAATPMTPTTNNSPVIEFN